MRPKSRIVFFLRMATPGNFIVNFRIGLSTHIGSALQGNPRAVPPSGTSTGGPATGPRSPRRAHESAEMSTRSKSRPMRCQRGAPVEVRGAPAGYRRRGCQFPVPFSRTPPERPQISFRTRQVATALGKAPQRVGDMLRIEGPSAASCAPCRRPTAQWRSGRAQEDDPPRCAWRRLRCQ